MYDHLLPEGPFAPSNSMRFMIVKRSGSNRDRKLGAMKNPSASCAVLAIIISIVTLAICCRTSLAAPSITTAPPWQSPWSDYQIIEWQIKSPDQYSRLKSIGVTGAAMLVNRDNISAVPSEQIAALEATGLRWYLENIATDFYSPYHRWFRDRPVDWLFAETKSIYAKNPNAAAALRRVPSLSDPRWIAKIQARLAQIVRMNRAYKPLYYDLGDETGIADLNAPWDFDFSEPSLRAMRSWLRGEYGTLASLNGEWGTDFRDWGHVIPLTTREAMRRSGQNYAPWADFKSWMDVAYAQALQAGTDAIHHADPTAVAGVEGVQLPGWGGYNYERLAKAVDLIEGTWSYFATVRALNPNLILLHTTSGTDRNESHQLWHALLEGERGIILWDPDNQIAGTNGDPGPQAQKMAPVLRELRGGIGALIINSVPVYDPVAILYSEASMRTQWILDWRSKGDEWASLNTDRQNVDNPWRAALRRYFESAVRSGLTPRFVTGDQILQGALQQGIRILMLPDAIALSPDVGNQIRKFVKSGGTVIADCEPGQFDGHSRKLAIPVLRDIFASQVTQRGRPSRLGRALYLVPPSAGDVDSNQSASGYWGTLNRAFLNRGVRPDVTVTTEKGGEATDVAIYRFRSGDVTIVGLDRISENDFAPELSPIATRRAAEPVMLDLHRKLYVYDIRGRRFVGKLSTAKFVLGGEGPTLLAISPTKLMPPTVIGPLQLLRGKRGVYRVSSGKESSRQQIGLFHAELTDPAGNIQVSSSQNFKTHDGRSTIAVRFGNGDMTGRWILTVTNVLSGETASVAIESR